MEIITTEGSIEIEVRGEFQNIPKGTYNVMTSGGQVRLEFKDKVFFFTPEDTTIDGVSFATTRELASKLGSFSRGGGNGGGVTKEELDAAVEEAEGYRDVSEVNATNAEAAAQEAAASASDAGAFAENAVASSDLAGSYAQLAEESAQALNNSVLLEDLALESKDILGFDPTKDQILGHRRGVPQYIDL